MVEEHRVARRVTEYLPDSITQEQAAYLLHSIWPKAPEAEVIKAAILCKQYGLNPLMRQVYLIEFGKDWAIVLGIKATRQIAQQALKKRNIRYSYADGPRVMTEVEQNTVRGKVEKDKIWAITILKDNYGNQYPGYGWWPANKQPYGTDKGNDAYNMAFIRSERNALDKLAPGELPDIETGDDTYIQGDYKLALEQGKQQFIQKVEKDIDELWGEKEKPEPEAQSTPIQEASQLEKKPTEVENDTEGKTKMNLADIKVKMIDARFTEKTAISWFKSKANYTGLDLSGSFGDILNRMSPEQLKFFLAELDDRTKMA